VKSRISASFREAFAQLPPHVQKGGAKAFDLWKQDPQHPSIQFKKVSGNPKIYSARIGIGWRAIGQLRGDTVTWVWIGSHAEYDKILSRP